jgi:hypothetical protein
MDLDERYFRAREASPVCTAQEVEEIYRCPLEAGPIRSLITSHYRSQGSIDWSILSRTDYVLCECENCRLVYQRNVPNEIVLNQLYNVMVSPVFLRRLDRERLTLDNSNSIAGEIEVLFRMTSKHPSDITFLDYGFGYGRWARVARAMGATVFATELGEEKAKAAAEVGVAMLLDEEVDRMRFDIVHTEQVFEHLVDPARNFKRLASVTDRLMKIAVPQHADIRKLIETRGMTNESPFERMLRGQRGKPFDDSYVAILPLEHLRCHRLRSLQKHEAGTGVLPFPACNDP